tara:strand:+ start:628 stop:804 length:177 start_codon:yes stop_codon:yes gene_type:complete
MKGQKDATPEEQRLWFEEDYWIAMKFEPMKMFVVLPAIIQLVVFGFMLLAFKVINTGL